MWYLSFEVDREEERYQGETLEDLVKSVIADGRGGKPLFCMQLTRDALPEEEQEFRKTYKELSENSKEVQEAYWVEYERKRALAIEEETIRSFQREVPYLNGAGIERFRKWMLEGLSTRFVDFRSSKADEIQEACFQNIEREISKCHGV